MTGTDERSPGSEVMRRAVTTKASRFVAWFIELPLTWHILGVVLVLAVGLGATYPSQVWTSDEGAVRFQVELLASDGSWTTARPFADLDPEEITSPIHGSTIVGDRYAPYTKQPLLPTLLVPVRRLAGERALVLPALLGTAVSAIMGALIAGALDRRLRNLTLWILALGTPLLFYGYTVLAHTLATALCGIAVVVAIRDRDRVSARWMIAVVAVFLAVLLRAEAVAFTLALAVAIVLPRSPANRTTRAAFSSLLAASAMSAFFANRLWAVSVGGTAPVTEGDGVFVWFRLLSGMFSSTLLTDFGTPRMLIIVLAMSGGIALLVMVVQREPGNVALQRTLAAASIAGAVGLVLVIPEPIGGVLTATPILLAGLVLVRREHVTDPRVALLLTLSAVFTLAVFMTQERGGGGLQWGGRYLMPMLPAAVPVALLALRSLLARSSFARPLVIGVLVALTLTLSVDAVQVLRTGRESSVALVGDLTALASRVEAVGTNPTVVSPHTHIGRHAWRTIDDTDYLLVPEEEFATYMWRLTQTRIEEFGVVGGWSPERAALFGSLGYEPVDVEDAPFIVVRRVDR